MDAGTIRPDGQRTAPRRPVLAVAKIVFQGSAVDCLVLDMSASGVRVSTQAMFNFPDEVRIELKSGAVHSAVRCWQRGLEAGFGFTGLLGLNGVAASAVRQLHLRVSRSGVLEATGQLAQARYYDHPELKAAARVAEVAVRLLEEALLKVSQGV